MSKYSTDGFYPQTAVLGIAAIVVCILIGNSRASDTGSEKPDADVIVSAPEMPDEKILQDPELLRQWRLQQALDGRLSAPALFATAADLEAEIKRLRELSTRHREIGRDTHAEACLDVAAWYQDCAALIGEHARAVELASAVYAPDRDEQALAREIANQRGHLKNLARRRPEVLQRRETVSR